jgi:PAS domain S-box-containing protein
MESPAISDSILQRLAQRATEEGVTLDELLSRFLDRPSTYQQNLESLVENFDGSIWSIDREYRLLAGNKTYYQILSYSIGREVKAGDNTLPENQGQALYEEWRSYYDRVLAGEKFILELTTRSFSTPRVFEYRFNPIFAEDGSVIGATVFARDITEIKQAEAALRESEGRFKLAASMARLGIWDWEISSDKTEWYGEMFNIYGISPEEFTGKGSDYIAFTRKDYRLSQEANIIKAFENGIREADVMNSQSLKLAPKELVIVRPDGTEATTIGDAIAIVDDEGKPLRMLGITIDISEQKALEKDLRIRDSAIKSSITAIGLADLAGNVTYVNHAFLHLWKYESEEEAIGRPAVSFWESPEEAKQIVDALQADKPFNGVVSARLNDGTLADIRLNASVIKDEQGNALCMMASFMDVTNEIQAEHLRLEQERLKASLKKEQEFNVLVQKAISALAHDVRTPLTVIANAKQILDRYFDRLDEDKRREKLDTIGKQLHYVLELLNEMSLTVKGSLDERVFQVRPLNLPALCQASISEIQETVGANYEISFINRSSIDVVNVDETLVSRILLNLLSNAVKFSREGGKISLELSQQDDWLRLSVKDSGIGIAEADIPHIFDPFYRAKNASHIRGTGLGLNIVKDCVERHRGKISAESQIGEGTRFLVELPMV